MKKRDVINIGIILLVLISVFFGFYKYIERLNSRENINQDDTDILVTPVEKNPAVEFCKENGGTVEKDSKNFFEEKQFCKLNNEERCELDNYFEGKCDWAKNLNTYIDEEVVELTGQVSMEKYNCDWCEKGVYEAYVLDLDKAINYENTDDLYKVGIQNNIELLQFFIHPNEFENYNGKKVTISGYLYPSHTEQHFSQVMLNPEIISWVDDNNCEVVCGDGACENPTISLDLSNSDCNFAENIQTCRQDCLSSKYASLYNYKFEIKDNETTKEYFNQFVKFEVPDESSVKENSIDTTSNLYTVGSFLINDNLSLELYFLFPDIPWGIESNEILVFSDSKIADSEFISCNEEGLMPLDPCHIDMREVEEYFDINLDGEDYRFWLPESQIGFLSMGYLLSDNTVRIDERPEKYSIKVLSDKYSQEELEEFLKIFIESYEILI